MRTRKNALIVFFAFWILQYVCCPLLFARDPQNCLFCHKYRRLRSFDTEGVLHNYYVDARLMSESIHRDVACTDCHSDIDKVPHNPVVEKVDCAKPCHIEEWKVISGGSFFSHQDIKKILDESVHGIKPDDPPEIAALKPDCKYCHLNALYTLAEEIPSDKVLKRCLNCHKEKGLHNIFIHISHRFKHKTSRPPLEIVELCASCHDDKDFQNIVGFTGSTAEAVDTYKETIHYRVLQFGGHDTAHCISCHASESIHDIRRPSDPKSSVYPQNRYRNCQSEGCHPGASPRISAIDSHLSRQKEKGPEIRIVEMIMEGVMFLTLFTLFTLMGMETYGRVRNRDARFFRWLRVPQRFSNVLASPNNNLVGKIPNLHRYVNFTPKGDYPRYSVHVVINHLLVVVTFSIAVITGLPLFFHNSSFSHTVINLLGGIDFTRKVHHFNAEVFTLNCIYHIFVLLFGTIKRIKKGTFDIRRTQIPLLKDFKDIYHDFRYFLGLEKMRPRMEKFMYKQKLHYFAMIWGSAVLTLSGVCLLFPDFMVRYLPFPKVTFNLLRLLHAEESILAFLVITLWHLYNVHVAPGRFPLQWTFWSGKITRDHQIEEHFLEYKRQVDEGIAEPEEPRVVKGEVR